MLDEEENDLDKVIKKLSFGAEVDASECDRIRVCETEHLLDELEPEWAVIQKKLQVICKGDTRALLRFSVNKHDEKSHHHKCYGFFCASLETIMKHQRDWPLYNQKQIVKGCLTFKRCLIEERSSFAEYIKSGWFINMSVAIDYTASNGDPADHSSLHHYDPDGADCKPNMYETAMRNVGNIMENYAFQKKFAGFGFGGIPDYLDSDQVNHCFCINKNPKDPMIDGLENLIKTYKESLNSIKLWGPSFFSKILENQIKMIKATN